MVMEGRETQYLNTPSPMEVTESGMETAVRFRQFINAYLPMEVTEPEIFISANKSQL
jgi:hypothetical protein